MPTTKKSVTVYLEKELYTEIVALADGQGRRVSNFIEQFLSVHLQGDIDKNELIEKMNPSLTLIRKAMRHAS
jgi:chromosome condensin MukBEF MukE localization factor